MLPARSCRGTTQCCARICLLAASARALDHFCVHHKLYFLPYTSLNLRTASKMFSLQQNTGQTRRNHEVSTQQCSVTGILPHQHIPSPTTCISRQSRPGLLIVNIDEVHVATPTCCCSCCHAAPTAPQAPHLLPNALARTKPSPAGPKPLPGVVTMLHFSRISANTSQLGLPGKPTHTYGASSPPVHEPATQEFERFHTEAPWATHEVDWCLTCWRVSITK